jgi:hypothetical protein
MQRASGNQVRDSITRFCLFGRIKKGFSDAERRAGSPRLCALPFRSKIRVGSQQVCILRMDGQEEKDADDDRNKYKPRNITGPK